MSSSITTAKVAAATKNRKDKEKQQQEVLQHTPIAKKTRSKIKASQTTESIIVNCDGSSQTTSSKTEIEVEDVVVNRRTTVEASSNSLTLDLNESIEFMNGFNFESNDYENNNTTTQLSSIKTNSMNTTYNVEDISKSLSSFSIETEKGILEKIEEIEFVNTSKGKKRLLCGGYNYIEDGGNKSKANKIYWKCSDSSCKARVWTNGYQAPALVRKNHDHLPNFEKNQLFKSELETKNKIINSQIESRELYIQQHQLHSTEDLVKLRMGEVFKKKPKQAKKDKNLQRLCETYKRTNNEKLLEFLNCVSLNFDMHKIMVVDSNSD